MKLFFLRYSIHNEISKKINKTLGEIGSHHFSRVAIVANPQNGYIV